MTLAVAVIVPVLARPHQVQRTIDDIRDATPSPHRVVFVADADDTAELAALEEAGADFIVMGRRSSYAKKINAGFRSTTEPLVFSAADDLHFHPGWFEAAASQIVGPVQVVGTNDLGNPRTFDGEHSTHTLFTREYIDTLGGTIDGGPGVVLHEAYPHQFCDDEFIAVAKARGVYAHASDSVVEHLHWLWGKADMDQTYRRGRQQHVAGKRIFQRRRVLWESPVGA